MSHQFGFLIYLWAAPYKFEKPYPGHGIEAALQGPGAWQWEGGGKRFHSNWCWAPGVTHYDSKEEVGEDK